MIGKLICWLWKHDFNWTQMPETLGTVAVACPRCARWVKLGVTGL